MVTWPVVPHLKPFRALRYDPGTVGPLDAVVSPPHDVVTPDRREAPVTASPYNAVRLLNPESPAEAARLLGAWKEEGALVREAEPAVWILEETFPGSEGGTRKRRGLVARVELTPYSAGKVLPHERTFAAPEGRSPRAPASRSHEAIADLPRPRGHDTRHSRARPGHGGDAGRRHEPSLAGHRR